MTSRYRGLIREELCIGHKYVEWDVEYAQLHHILRSPTFKIDAQEYILQLQTENVWQWIQLKLLRMDMPTNDDLQCYMGVKRADGTYHNDIAREHSNQGTSIACTNVFEISVIERLCLYPDNHLSFFLRMNAQGTQEEGKICKHGYSDIITTGEGRILVEECSFHKHVEWVVEYDMLNDEIVTSPQFMVGTQRYLLDVRTYDDIFRIHLFRMGPSVENRVQCVCGIKRRDGSYDHNVEISYLELLENCEMWMDIETIYRKMLFGMESLFVSANGTVTFFVRMDEESTHAGAQTCTHGISQMTPAGEGRIREEMCSDHIQVDWDFEFKLLQQYDSTLISPIFEIGGQLYLMDLRMRNDRAVLCLYSIGRPSRSQVRFFLGAKHGDGSYYHKTESGLLNDADDFDVWQPEDACLILSVTDLERDLSSSGVHLKFFVRIHIERTPSVPKTCTHDMSTRGVGSVDEVEWATYKQVDWYAVCEPSSRTVTSPSFSVADQLYLWELSCKGKGITVLTLYRSGPSVNKSVRWWSFVKRNDGFCRQHGSICEPLDLEYETFGMWKPVGIPNQIINDLDGKGPLIFRFLMSLEKTSTSMNVPTSANSETQQEFKRVPGEDVVFIVDDKEYEMHRAVLGLRVPAFEAMFLHDFTENRSGVVRIYDCEPDVFRLFLDFVYSGKETVVTSETCFALFVVADKYLFTELKDLCLLEIEKVIVSMDNFFDIVKYCLMHGDDDVLRKATNFFSKNKIIVQTETWRDFYRNNIDAANNLLTKAFLPSV